MTSPRVLLCLDGGAVDALLDASIPLLSTAVTWVPTHVVDTRREHELGFLRGGLAGAGRLSRSQQAAIDSATAEHTRATIEAAEIVLLRRGLSREPPQIRVGEPGREICEIAAATSATAIVLFASRRRARAGSGPHSVGHTARFVVDHAPCPVLVLRGGS
jgi:nucleotide-binding universal stress UspA family protein